ncbi:iron ABC transporter permease [Constrictibacter sp. MBR-5]|jgi:iron complex transport system permease protein|uniref:FecCD family ABC transporter permease n=1 Tax=Constrictibacter sp. MBR-5 TaxID=3156467 RepID=UPI003391D24A
MRAADPALTLPGGVAAGDRRTVARTFVGLLALLLAATILLSAAVGPAGFGFDVLRPLFAGDTAADANALILWEIRLPRTLLGVMVGGSLAIAGALMQGLFRNPLADPGLIGISSGSALGAVTMIVLGAGPLAPVALALSIYALPTAAFVGGLSVTILLYAIATREGRTSVATMLLAGIALAALSAAATGLLIFGSDDQQLREITFWSLGSLGGATWIKVATLAPVLLAAALVVPLLSRGLNALLLGQAEAFHLGVPVQLVKRTVIVVAAALTGAAVAFTGVIGFVGIVAPHLLRLAIGPDHRYLLPGSALLGGIVMVAADMVARTVVAPAELPIGIVAAAMGAPFFLWILLRQRGVVDL